MRTALQHTTGVHEFSAVAWSRLLLLLFLASLAGADPYRPTGALVNSLGLGGLSRDANASQLFHNPALLADILNSDCVAGLDGLPLEEAYSLAGAARIASNTAIGMGVRRVSFDSMDEGQLLLSSAFAPTPLFWPGFSMKYLFARGEAALDLDLGAVWNPARRVRLGSCIENVLASADGRTRMRSASLQVQYFWTPYAVDGLGIFFRSELDTLHYNAGVSIEKRFFHNPQFGLRMGGHVQRDDIEDDGITLGAMSRYDIRQHRVEVEYAFRTSGLSAARHSASVHFGLWGARDRVAPDIFVQPNRTYLTPDGDGVDDALYFQLKAQDDPGGAGFHNWSLVIAARDSATNRPRPVKSYVGGGIPPSTIIWDARSSQGRLVEPGDYFYQFTATDRNGNQAKTDWRLFRVQ